MFKEKTRLDKTLDKHKAKLVVQGFSQTLGVDYFEIFSLIVKTTKIRIVFVLAFCFGWKMRLVDINNAFLNGDLEKRCLYEAT